MAFMKLYMKVREGPHPIPIITVCKWASHQIQIQHS